MELRHLRYFIAVAEALSFRKASDRLRIAQPALSKQVRQLEDCLGTPLLERTTRGVFLTEAGSVFLDEARDILERVEMASVATRDAGSGVGGKLVISGFGPVTASFLPAALSEFRTRYPKVDVNIRDLSIPDKITALKSGLIQIGFHICSSGIVLPSSIDSFPILNTRLAIGMCYQHRLAQAPEVSLSDLIEEQLLCAEGPNRIDLHRQRTLALFAARNIPHRPIKQIGTFDALITLVAGNHGVSLLIPTRTAASSNRIVFKPIRDEGDDFKATVSVIWRKGSNSTLARNFVDVLRSLPIAAEPTA